MDDEIQDPISDLVAGAIHHHELYQAWITAGFNEDQAMELLQFFIIECIRSVD